MTATGHIRKRGESFQVVVELPTTTSGKRRRIYKTVKGSKKQAEGVLRQLLQEIEGQSYIRPSKITVAEWIHQWLNLYIEGSRSVTTVEGYRNQIEKYIIPTLGDIFLQDLSPSMVQRWINGLREISQKWETFISEDHSQYLAESIHRYGKSSDGGVGEKESVRIY